MYINLEVFKNSGLCASDLLFLAALNQIESDWIALNLLEDRYERFKERSWLKHVKPKSKKEHPYKSLRLSDTGKQLLAELEDAPVEEEDKIVGEWLIKHYKGLGKEVGNSKRLLRHIRDFRLKSGIQKNNLINLCLAFLADDDNMMYNNVLEYAFYKPPTAFQTRFNLEDSRLYKYYLKRANYFKSTFEEY